MFITVFCDSQVEKYSQGRSLETLKEYVEKNIPQDMVSTTIYLTCSRYRREGVGGQGEGVRGSCMLLF